MSWSQKRVIIGSRQRVNKSDITTHWAAAHLLTYIDNGFTHFDTADHYADGEDILGEAKNMLRTKRCEDTIYVATKRVPDAGPMVPDEVERAIRISLQRLQTDSIDLLQFHDRLPDAPYGLDRLQELDKLRKLWLIKKIWLTNASTDYIKKVIAAGIPIVSNQICYSLLAQRPSSEMAQFCLENNIELLAFGTVAGWFFSEKRLNKLEPSIDTPSNASLKKYKRFVDVRGGRTLFQKLLHVLDKIAKSHKVSIATVASNFILKQPAVWAVIVGVRLGESEHIEENKKILSLELSDTEKQMIQVVLDEWIPLPGDFGDEYRLDHSAYNGWHESLTSTGTSGYKGHQNDYIK